MSSGRELAARAATRFVTNKWAPACMEERNSGPRPRPAPRPPALTSTEVISAFDRSFLPPTLMSHLLMRTDYVQPFRRSSTRRIVRLYQASCDLIIRNVDLRHVKLEGVACQQIGPTRLTHSSVISHHSLNADRTIAGEWERGGGVIRKLRGDADFGANERPRFHRAPARFGIHAVSDNSTVDPPEGAARYPEHACR
ncbi:unnamed protein product, partial [Iphiclides podalirius]